MKFVEVWTEAFPNGTLPRKEVSIRDNPEQITLEIGVKDWGQKIEVKTLSYDS